VDVTDEASVERALAGTFERFGHLNILVITPVSHSEHP